MRRFLLLLAVLVVLALGVWLALRSQREPNRELSLPEREAPSPIPAPASSEAPLESASSSSSATSSTAPAEQPASAADSPVTRFHVNGVVRVVGNRALVAQRRIQLGYWSVHDENDGSKPRGADGLRRHEPTMLTDDDGRFSFSVPVHARLDDLEVLPTEVIEGRRRVRPIPLHKQRQRLGGLEVLADVELEFGVHEAPILSGQVLDAQTHEPVEGARLFAKLVSVRGVGAVSNKQGRFATPTRDFDSVDVENELKSVEVSHPDYPITRVEAPRPQVDGTLVPMTIELARGCVVAGVVLDPNETPIPRVGLRLRPVVGDAASPVHEIAGDIGSSTDKLGRFRFQAVEPFQRAYLVVTSRPRETPWSCSEPRILLDGASGSLSDLRVHLEFEATVRVRARYPDGTEVRPGQMQVSSPDSGAEAQLDWNGPEFAFPAGRPVRVIVRSWDPKLGSHASRLFGETTVTLPVGASETTTVDVRLQSDPEFPPTVARPANDRDRMIAPDWTTPWIAVRALSPDRKTLAEAHADLNQFKGLSCSDAAGRKLIGCPRGWNVLEVGAAGYRTRLFEVLSDDRERAPLDVVLEREP